MLHKLNVVQRICAMLCYLLLKFTVLLTLNYSLLLLTTSFVFVNSQPSSLHPTSDHPISQAEFFSKIQALSRSNVNRFEKAPKLQPPLRYDDYHSQQQERLYQNIPNRIPYSVAVGVNVGDNGADADRDLSPLIADQSRVPAPSLNLPSNVREAWLSSRIHEIRRHPQSASSSASKRTFRPYRQPNGVPYIQNAGALFRQARHPDGTPRLLDAYSNPQADPPGYEPPPSYDPTASTTAFSGSCNHKDCIKNNSLISKMAEEEAEEGTGSHESYGRQPPSRTQSESISTDLESTAGSYNPQQLLSSRTQPQELEQPEQSAFSGGAQISDYLPSDEPSTQPSNPDIQRAHEEALSSSAPPHDINIQQQYPAQRISYSQGDFDSPQPKASSRLSNTRTSGSINTRYPSRPTGSGYGYSQQRGSYGSYGPVPPPRGGYSGATYFFPRPRSRNDGNRPSPIPQYTYYMNYVPTPSQYSGGAQLSDYTHPPSDTYSSPPTTSSIVYSTTPVNIPSSSMKPSTQIPRSQVSKI
ncbi:unnamed protein product [Anisakis simplex]|uniref:Chitin-binding type-2 domain-containing protein n=1 Tax=Anisakis simplex TaxID=6269 RepID=A0A0M3K033_ANISI|nr:unnamed protein product [Anisakis simplex]